MTQSAIKNIDRFLDVVRSGITTKEIADQYGIGQQEARN